MELEAEIGVMYLQAKDSSWKQAPKAGRGLEQIFPLGLQKESTLRMPGFQSFGLMKREIINVVLSHPACGILKRPP